MPSVCGVAISLYKFCASCGPSEPASINFHFLDFFLRVGGIREGEEAKAICRLVMVCPVNGEGMGYLWMLSFIFGYGKGPFCGNRNGRDDSFPFVQIFFGMALFVGSGISVFLCLLRTPGLPGRNFGQTVFPDTLFLSVQIVI